MTKQQKTFTKRIKRNQVFASKKHPDKSTQTIIAEYMRFHPLCKIKS